METLTIQEAWQKLGRKLAIRIPEKLIAWLDAPEREVKRQHPLTILIILLIGCLSAASITNLFTRAELHHPGVSAYATGAGLALLVPLSIFFAVYVPLGKWGRVGAWAISLVFAGMSAAIQYKIYAPGVNEFNLEAVAFGAGIPVAECLLAVLEGILINYLKREAVRKQTEAQAEVKALQMRQAAENAAKVQAEEQAEKQRQAAIFEAQRQAEQRRIEAEQARVQAEQAAAEFAFRLEAQRQKLALDLELKRAAALNKLNKVDLPLDSVNQASESKPGDEAKLIQFYRSNPKATQRLAADSTGLSQSKVNRILSDLKERQLVTVNGHGVQFRETE